MGDLISKHVRRAFCDHLVSKGTLRMIRDLFDVADIPQRNIPDGSTLYGERRTLVERYYAGLDWSSRRDVRKALAVYERILDHLDPDSDEFRRLTNPLRREGFRYQDGRLVTGDSLNLMAVEEASSLTDPAVLREHLRRIEDAVESDPARAIGSAKELLESVAKCILTECGRDPEEFEASLPRLAKEAMRSLNLSAEQIPQAARGVELLKQMLSGMWQIVSATAELRNLYGTGHGRMRPTTLQPRHARLVAGAVATFSTFLLETLDHRKRG